MARIPVETKSPQNPGFAMKVLSFLDKTHNLATKGIGESGALIRQVPILGATLIEPIAFTGGRIAEHYGNAMDRYAAKAAARGDASKAEKRLRPEDVETLRREATRPQPA